MAGQIFSVNLKKISVKIFGGSNINLSEQKLYLSVLFFIGNAEIEKRCHITGQCIHTNSNLVVY